MAVPVDFHDRSAGCEAAAPYMLARMEGTDRELGQQPLGGGSRSPNMQPLQLWFKGLLYIVKVKILPGISFSLVWQLSSKSTNLRQATSHDQHVKMKKEGHTKRSYDTKTQSKYLLRLRDCGLVHHIPAPHLCVAYHLNDKLDHFSNTCKISFHSFPPEREYNKKQ
jgi:hypothetical protein